MIETSMGLPNTCCKCGKPAGKTWWADNEDAARAGGGMHAQCVQGAEGGQVSIEAPQFVATQTPIVNDAPIETATPIVVKAVAPRKVTKKAKRA